MDNINVTKKTIYNMTNHLNNQDILTQIRILFPYDNTMCKEKYNETIQDYLYEEIISKL